MKILACFDSFKGCLSAAEACHTAAEALSFCLPGVEVVELPMSDGGEGLVDCLSQALGLLMVQVQVHGPLMEERMARYGISPDGKTAYMEMAETCGLTLVPQERRNPLHTTTYGVGEMLLDAVHRGCCQIVMGIGGSATCDGGEGMVQALQYYIKYQEDTCIVDGRPIRVLVASDVSNPLYGPQGAACVFAPQKGATAEQVVLLDKRLRRFASLTQQSGIAQPALALHPGAGAAGGLGYALMAYLKAELRPGIDLVLDALGFERQLQDASLVLTGEGKSDRQTLMGKVPQGVLQKSDAYGIPVCLLSGAVEHVQVLCDAGFAKVVSINQGDTRPLSQLLRQEVARENLRRTIIGLIKEIQNIQPHNPQTNAGHTKESE